MDDYFKSMDRKNCIHSITVSETIMDDESFDIEECDVCLTEMGEDGQLHFCGCGEEISDEQCEQWGGLCSVCSWGIKH